MDIEDYGNSGFIGKKIEIDTPSLDLEWSEPYVTFIAAKNAYKLSLEEFVIASYNMFIDKNSDGSSKKIIAIGDNGKELFCDAVNTVYTKMFEMEKKSRLFWNCLPILEDKQTGVIVYDGDQESANPKFRKHKLLTRNFLRFDFTMDFTTVVYNDEDPVGTILDVPYTLDYTNYQDLTPQIYKEYIISVSEYALAVKKLVKTITGSKI